MNNALYYWENSETKLNCIMFCFIKDKNEHLGRIKQFNFNNGEYVLGVAPTANGMKMKIHFDILLYGYLLLVK